MTNGLSTFLLNAYGHTTGKERSSTDRPVVIQIDDRNENDVYPGFCGICVTVPNPEDGTFLLRLENSPNNWELEELVESYGGKVQQGHTGTTITISLKPKDTSAVRALAKSIRRITGRGQKYLDRNWKWICPRTAKSLERLAGLLASFNKARGEEERRRRRQAHRKPGITGYLL
jgi:hypothetical protein